MNNKSPFADKIAGLALKPEPRHIEAFMRVETDDNLEGLTEAQFRAAASRAASCVEECDTETCEALAASYGL